MKPVYPIALALLLFATAPSFAQSVKGVALADFKSEYIEITPFQIAFSRKMNVNVDYGQERRALHAADVRLRDNNGVDLEFYSTADVLNFFHDRGYELVQALGHTSKDGTGFSYLMRRGRN